MEDGAVGGFVQRGVAAAGDERAVVEMGGSGTVNEGTRATEASVRGFWKCYRGAYGHLKAWLAITLDRILALQAAYIRCIDSNALEAWPDFFTDDCLYKVTTAENHRNGFAGRHHLRRLQGHADRPHRRAAPGQHLREAELPAHPRPADRD